MNPFSNFFNHVHDTPLDFPQLAAVGSMLGSGAVVICGEDSCMLDMALNAVRFFRNESCGKCVPCRTGSAKLTDILTAWTRGRRGPQDMALYEDLRQAMRLASICGLGQVVHVPIASVLKHFADEVEAHAKGSCPAGVCFKIGAAA